MNATISSRKNNRIPISADRATKTGIDRAKRTGIDRAMPSAIDRAMPSAIDRAIISAFDRAIISAFDRAKISAFDRATKTGIDRARISNFNCYVFQRTKIQYQSIFFRGKSFCISVPIIFSRTYNLPILRYCNLHFIPFDPMYRNIQSL